eukprot:Gb_24360 [translate_table: standard]
MVVGGNPRQLSVSQPPPTKFPALKSVVCAVPLTEGRRSLASHTVVVLPLPSRILSIDTPTPKSSTNITLKLALSTCQSATQAYNNAYQATQALWRNHPSPMLSHTGLQCSTKATQALSRRISHCQFSLTASLDDSVGNATQGSQAKSNIATSHSRPHRLSLWQNQPSPGSHPTAYIGGWAHNTTAPVLLPSCLYALSLELTLEYALAGNTSTPGNYPTPCLSVAPQFGSIIVHFFSPSSTYLSASFYN